MEHHFLHSKKMSLYRVFSLSICFFSFSFSSLFGNLPKKSIANKNKTNKTLKRDKKPIRQPISERNETNSAFQTTLRRKKYQAPNASSQEINQKTLNTFGSGGIQETLQAAPGLHTSQHNGRGKAQQFFLRGFDAVHGAELEIRLQGIPINEASNIHGQGYADIGFLLTKTISKFRIHKGPFLSYQGDFALSGSLEFDLGLPKRGFFVELTGDTFLRRQVGLYWGPSGMNEETFIGIQAGQSNGFGARRGWKEGRGIAQFQWSSGAFHFRTMILGYISDFESAGILRNIEYIEKNKLFYDPQKDGLGGRSSRLIGQGFIKWKGHHQEISVMGYSTLRTLQLKEDFTGFLLYEEGDAFEQLQQTLQIGSLAHWKMSWRWREYRQQFFIGAEVRFDHIDQEQHRFNEMNIRHTTEIDANLKIGQYSSWIQLRLQPFSIISTDIGLRATLLTSSVHEKKEPSHILFHQRPGWHLSPRANLRMRIAKQWKLFTSYGLGFRTVQVRSLRDKESNPFQEAHQVELGTKAFFGTWGHLSFALFGIFTSQELIFDHASASQTNAGASWRAGGEVEGSFHLFKKWLRLESSLSYSEGTLLETSEPIPFVPRLLLRSGLVGRWKWNQRSKKRKWELESTIRFSFLGPRPLPYGFLSDTIFLVNAFVRLQINAFFLRLEGNNLFNSQWKDGQFVYASSPPNKISRQELPQKHFTAGPPLQLLFSLGIRLF